MAGRKPTELQGAPRLIRDAVDWGTRPAAVKYVPDGDGVGVLCDHGGARYAFEAVRVAGINAEELDDPDPNVAGRARAAKAYLEGLLPEGRHVVLRTKGVDRYGRLVADVGYIDGGGNLADVGEEMVRAGHAQVVAP